MNQETERTIDYHSGEKLLKVFFIVEVLCKREKSFTSILENFMFSQNKLQIVCLVVYTMTDFKEKKITDQPLGG